MEANIITSKEFAAAVDKVGGDEAAAALLGVSAASVKRYRQGRLPDFRQPLIRRRMARFLPGAPPPPLELVSSEDLIAELAYRLRAQLPVQALGESDHDSVNPKSDGDVGRDTASRTRGSSPAVGRRRKSSGDAEGDQRGTRTQRDGKI